MLRKFDDNALDEQMPPWPPGKKYSLLGKDFEIAPSYFLR